MKFSLFREHGAQNSKPVFDAFANSLTGAGHTVVDNDYNSDCLLYTSDAADE